MNKLNMKTKNIADENFAALAKLFPNALTETITGYDENGNAIIERAIDADVLRQEISCKVVEGRDERYQFTWPDKKKSILLANAPISATLRPCKEESVNFDSTENLYIEGDNLDVLKLLHETYLGKVKMIYIDPPYNTGNDFIYNDDFSGKVADYIEKSGQLDFYGNRLVQNTESNGRFHTDWLNMIYPRIKVAKDLLCDDGVIFVSVGQEELDNITKAMNEVFGEVNKVGLVSRVTKTASNNGTYFAPSVDYVLCYAKNINLLPKFVGEVDESLYKKIEVIGEHKGEKYRDDVALYQAALRDLRPNQKFFIECPDGSKVIPPCSQLDEIMREGDGRWRWTKERYEKDKHLLVFKETKSSPLLDEYGHKAKYNVYTKSYLSERQESGTLPRDLWTDFINRKGADLLKKYKIPFDFSKPYELIVYMMKIANIGTDDIVCDFFSGSATTAHAVMSLNAEDGKKRKFIMVQLPEKIDTSSQAYKVGFKNICEIGKERIRRVGEKIKSDSPVTTQNLDTGFRVLKCGTSNMKDIYYNPVEIQQHSLFETTDNIKEDRTPEDLLFQVMLDLGVLLSSKIEETEVAGKKIFNVADNFLVACFDNDITEETVKAVAQMEPYYAVFRDSCMANDSVATNFDQIFATYSPSTVRKVL